ncbi:glycoside hydrolase family 127 protein, partial [candidate division KSB1 bacterium]|nr:glycoside hydrolase family 127 protein [candidate division KSB1 bacterium]
TCNMHQGWPKLTQNLWYATPDSGLAALVYGPSQVQAKVADGVEVCFTEATTYPFSETIHFKFTSSKPVVFPLHLRIPGWCAKAQALINGDHFDDYKGGQIIRIHRVWQNNDALELILPMTVRISRWWDAAAAVERGPLVYSLRLGESWKWIESQDKWGDYWEVHPTDDWNYGLLEEAVKNPEQGFKVVQQDPAPMTPWNLQDAPVKIMTKGKRIPEWQLYQNSAGPLPWSPVTNLQDEPTVELTLVPYGCTTLRITEFPVVR